MKFYPLSRILLTLSALIVTACTAETQAEFINKLTLPKGFVIERFANLKSLGHPRMMALDKKGHLLVTLVDTGKVVMLDASGKTSVITQDLDSPNGITMLGDDLLVATPNTVYLLTAKANGWGEPKPLIQHLATGHHTLKSIKVGPDGYLYLNVGSSCNVCVENDPTRATILRYTAQGQAAGALKTVGHHAQSAIWATGLRNSQGFAWHPSTGDFYATNEGADNRSDIKNGKVNDDVPPEHLNIIKPSLFYGWPYCWADANNQGAMFQDPNFIGQDHICENAEAPAITLPAHSTPIGITFLNNSNFPAEYQSDALVALHGSWNRKQHSGYEIVRIQFKNNLPTSVEPFVTGWLQHNESWGRPVDIVTGSDGNIYVSDDQSAWIYRIIYKNK